MQRSRRVFAASRLDESSEAENEHSHASLEQIDEVDSTNFDDRGRSMGIKSSWHGTRSLNQPGSESRDDGPSRDSIPEDYESDGDSKGGHMVDIGLESTVVDNEPPADLTTETPIDDSPAPFQQFRSGGQHPDRFPLRREATAESDMSTSQRPSSAGTGVLPSTGPVSDGETFKHDSFFAWLYLIAVASLFATFVLVWLHTDPEDGRKRRGDTIYTVLRASFHLLAVDTLVSIIVSVIWLAALRSFVRPLTLLIIIAVPIILISFSLYPFISSFQGRTGGVGFQDWAMRWSSLVPGVGAIVWIYLIYKGRHAISSAIQILEFSSRILGANPGLFMVGFGTLGTTVLWTWAWLVMFTRVFLGGYFSPSISRFIISVSTWWLGAYFVLMYIWTISIISGVQRGATGATVSQWYFHRNIVPAPSGGEVVWAALNHALTTIFGSISLSTLLALVIRLPLLVLPRRLAAGLSIFAYSFIPTPIAALTNPLTLTYAAIHSQSLGASARGLSQMEFISPLAPTTTLTPRVFASRRGNTAPLLPYRLAKLLLHATRFIMTIALGFAGWVITARQLRISLPDGAGVSGSLYAYVVGIVAGFIGWGVLGSMEGVLSGIVDAVVICYGSEKRMPGGGGAYCMEAAYLFGDRGSADGIEGP